MLTWSWRVCVTKLRPECSSSSPHTPRGKLFQRYPPDRHTPPSSARHSSGVRGPKYTRSAEGHHSLARACLPIPHSCPRPEAIPSQLVHPPCPTPRASAHSPVLEADSRWAQRRGVSQPHVSRNTRVGSRTIQTADGRVRARVGTFPEGLFVAEKGRVGRVEVGADGAGRQLGATACKRVCNS